MSAVDLQPEDLHKLFRPCSSDPLVNVHCHCDDQKVTLTGSVSRFYHVQLAIEAARKLAEGRKIDIRIEVVSPPDSCQFRGLEVFGCGRTL